MKKHSLLVLFSLVFAFAACGGGETKKEETAKFKIAAISGYFAQGLGVNIVKGLEKAKAELPIDFKLIDTGTRSLDYQEQFNSVAKTGSYDLIFVMGWELVDSLMSTAKAYPNQRFVFIDGILDDPNMIYIRFAEHEGSFLAGVLAAGMSKGDTVGFIGGRDIPVIRNFLMGYEQGVKYAKPNATVKALFAGTFDDPGRGKELTLSLYKEGVDIVFNVAGPTGEGILQAAKDTENKFAIGVDIDQSATAPNSIPSSMVKNIDIGVYNIIKELVDNNGSLPPSAVTLGVKEGGVGLVRNESYNKLVPDHVKKSVIDAETAIKSGSVSVKSIY